MHLLAAIYHEIVLKLYTPSNLFKEETVHVAHFFIFIYMHANGKPLDILLIDTGHIVY